MIRIKLYESDKHRNECTFRPYLKAQEVLRDIGIEFTSGDSYDYAWIAQASITNKNVSLQQSVTEGLEFLSNIDGDYMLLDGQDSTSLIGTYDVFKQSNALLLMKNSLLKDRSLYKQGWKMGRYYWGVGDYALPDFDSHSERIVLSGTNWLSTHHAGVNMQCYDINRPRHYDVSAMFQYPSVKVNMEYNKETSCYYDRFRSPLIQSIEGLDCNIAKLENGVRVSQQEYYNHMFNSKIILAPYGYGEMAPRDLEAAMFGCILIKPDMSYVDTKPDIFEDGVTYIACKHDFSDLQEKVYDVLENYQEYYYIVENMRKTIEKELSVESLAINLYNLFKNRIVA